MTGFGNMTARKAAMTMAVRDQFVKSARAAGVRKRAAEEAKRAALAKTVDAVGRECRYGGGDPEPEIPRKVVMRIEDGDSGRVKCAMVVEIADTPALMRTGLSKRASMNPDGGMWFDCHGPFWMKDVKFPLDLCYLDSSGRVTEKVAMAKDESGRTLYGRKSAESVQAVELPAGYCDRHGVEVGDYLVPVERLD